MIEGLKFRMASQELHDYLTQRIQYHAGRDDFYQQQVNALRVGHAEAPVEYSGGNPVDALTRKAQEHRNKTRMFTFMRDHLITGETYELTNEDLVKIEILDRYL